MRLLHCPARTRASFDDRSLCRARLVPVMVLAQRAGLADRVAKHVGPGKHCGVNAYLKIRAWSPGWWPRADSIDDLDLLRHGADA